MSPANWTTHNATYPSFYFSEPASFMVLYLLLNFTFLNSAPINILEGKLEIGLIAAEYALGGNAGKIMGGVLALLPYLNRQCYDDGRPTRITGHWRGLYAVQ